jgi:hypothetical protein
MVKLKVGLVADIQYAETVPYKDRFFKNGLLKLDCCIQHLNLHRLDFAINLGDSIDQGFQHFGPVLDRFDKMTIPAYHLAGNHDFEVEDFAKEKVLTRLGLPACGYRAFTVGKHRFLMLNSNAESLHAYPKDHKCYHEATEKLKELEKKGYVYANFWNGGLGHQQLQWMEEQLQMSRKAGEKVMIFCHQPFYPEDRHNLWDTEDVLQMISNYDHVIAWFCGHNHDGNYGLWNHCHCINIKGLVETEKKICGAVAEIEENVISIKGFGREPDRLLTF